MTALLIIGALLGIMAALGDRPTDWWYRRQERRWNEQERERLNREACDRMNREYWNKPSFLRQEDDE